MRCSEYKPRLESGCLEKYAFSGIIEFVKNNPSGLLNLSDVTWTHQCGTSLVTLLMGGKVLFIPSKYVYQLMTLAGYAKIVRKVAQQNKERFPPSL